jgi:two-component system phosphate regulon sensor histidine kinase PhoR
MTRCEFPNDSSGGDKARSRELHGNGLGLSIVKHLSHAFGGSVELQSELGEGRRFLVKLPLSDSC